MIRKRTWTHNGVPGTSWQVDYYDNAGKRQRFSFPTKAAAEAADLKARTEVNGGIHTPKGKSITVAEAGERWIAKCEELKREPTTVARYKQHLKLDIVPYLGAVKLAALTSPMVIDFMDKLQRDGRSQQAIDKARKALGSILAYCVRRGLVAHNAVKDMGNVERTSDRHETPPQVGVDIPLRSEIQAIVKALDGHRYRALLTVAMTAGLRASELRGLRWRDVDLKAGTLTVSQRADRHGNMGSPKSTAGRRTIPLMAFVVNMLREHKLATPANELDLVFPNGLGHVDHLNTISLGWGRVQVAAGVTNGVDNDGQPVAKYPGLHSLRHYFASWCINRQADGGLELDAKRVQQLMGHSTIGMTLDTYSHLFPRANQAAEMAAAEQSWHA